MADTTENEPTPSWIDAAFVQKALLNSGEKNSIVTGFTTELATAPGENYSSVIYRVKAALNDRSERWFLVKIVPSGGRIEKWAKKTKAFTREIIMLAVLLPQIETFLEEAAPGRWTQLAARCPMHRDDTEIYIVVEDLQAQGFHLADKKRGLDLRHSLLALRSLARYHAASHLLIKRNPSLIPRLDSFYRRQPEHTKIILESCIMGAAEACRSWTGFEQEALILEKFMPNMMETLTQLNDPNPNMFNVIVHGDFWTNNMMFRYGHGKCPCDIRMVDFQGSHVCSPTMDLLYFLTSSLGEDVSTHHKDFLIDEYYSALNEAMSLLGMEAPSFNRFLAEMDAHGPYSLVGTVVVYPMAIASNPSDFASIVSGEQNPLLCLYNTPQIKTFLQRMLRDLKSRGWLTASQKVKH